jgi:hypothetical protein
MFDSESNQTDPSRQAAIKLQIAPKTRGITAEITTHEHTWTIDRSLV